MISFWSVLPTENDLLPEHCRRCGHREVMGKSDVIIQSGIMKEGKASVMFFPPLFFFLPAKNCCYVSIALKILLASDKKDFSLTAFHFHLESFGAFRNLFFTEKVEPFPSFGQSQNLFSTAVGVDGNKSAVIINRVLSFTENVYSVFAGQKVSG